MYPSDYGYAVLASDCARTIELRKYNQTKTCINNNWLYQGSSTFQWLISPNSSTDSYVLCVDKFGYISDSYYTGDSIFSSDDNSFSPVMALRSDVVVTGSGTQSEPYVMQ